MSPVLGFVFPVIVDDLEGQETHREFGGQNSDGGTVIDSKGGSKEMLIKLVPGPAVDDSDRIKLSVDCIYMDRLIRMKMLIVNIFPANFIY